MNPYKWSRDELDQRDIPDEAKEFLCSEGLSTWTDYPAIEFGPYSSDGAFVIGQCGGDPVIIKEPSGVVIIENDDGSEIYVNSRVSIIPDFINLIISGLSLDEVRATMASKDPSVFNAIQDSFWVQVLCDCEVQGLLE